MKIRAKEDFFTFQTGNVPADKVVDFPENTDGAKMALSVVLSSGWAEKVD